MKQADILILLFGPTGRDPEAVIPLSWYLEKVFKYNVHFGSMFDARYLINKYCPKVLLVNNIAGSEFNVAAANYAYDNGVKVLSLTSEGLFKKEEMESCIWGNNRSKKMNWHKMFVWSKIFLKMAQEYLPGSKHTFDISGSTGIDRYHIYKFLPRKMILGKYGKEKYKKVIIYAGFAFGYIFDDECVKEYKTPKEKVSLLKNDMFEVKKILRQLITRNLDTLFILKKHPGEFNLHMEIDYDWKFENLLILEEQERLADLIQISDVYMVYESTSSFEAYALDKPVINIFPSKTDKFRHDAYQGNCLVKSYRNAQNIIDEFYKTGKIKDFQKRKRIRRKIIRDNIDSDDGLNSWRTAEKIDKFMSRQKLVKRSRRSLYGFLLHLILKYSKLLLLLPRFRRSKILQNYNEMDKFFALKKEYAPQINSFYLTKIYGK